MQLAVEPALPFRAAAVDAVLETRLGVTDLGPDPLDQLGRIVEGLGPGLVDLGAERGGERVNLADRRSAHSVPGSVEPRDQTIDRREPHVVGRIVEKLEQSG